MYPLIQLGPLRLASGGLVVLLATIALYVLFQRVARRRGGSVLAAQAESCALPVVLGAIAGARLWYGLFNLDLYARQPLLLFTPRYGNLAWPGALLGGLLVAYAWCRRHDYDMLALGDSIALTLPLAEAIACVGTFLSGDGLGVPTALPWGIDMFGTSRHPTQLYGVLASLVVFWVVRVLARRRPAPGTIMVAFLACEGTILLVLEALRADSLVFPSGIRAAQVFGLALVLFAASRSHAGQEQPLPATPTEVESTV